MSQFQLESEIKNLMIRSNDVTETKGPVPRWYRKALESSAKKQQNNISRLNTSNIQKTPKATDSGDNSLVSKTPSKTPAKTPKKTPGHTRKPPVKPNSKAVIGGGDRFIPNRSTTNYEVNHYLLTKSFANENNGYEDESDENSPDSNREEASKALSNAIVGCDISKTRILSFATKAPLAPAGFQNEMRVLYSKGVTPASQQKSKRVIPQTADRILDAPEIKNDFYINVLDWGAKNILAVGLANRVFLWNASNCKIDLLLELDFSTDYVSSLSWIGDGNHLAVAGGNGEVQLWDVTKSKKVRSLGGQTTRIGSLSWNQYILSSGSRSGQVNHHDVRSANHLVGSLAAHTQSICGLKWSKDGRYLASGGNDNLLQIWPCAYGECFTQTEPLHTFSQHNSAVKALSWCPWNPSLLASGGGTADRTIRIWNSNSGACLSTIDTKSQVCAILWSNEYKELISGHGYAMNQLTIWKYPTMAKIAELTGHNERILNMALSPDGSTVVSASADETLRLWKCFVTDSKKKKRTIEDKSGNTLLRTCIR